MPTYATSYLPHPDLDQSCVVPITTLATGRSMPRTSTGRLTDALFCRYGEGASEVVVFSWDAASAQLKKLGLVTLAHHGKDATTIGQPLHLAAVPSCSTGEPGGLILIISAPTGRACTVTGSMQDA